MKELIIDENDRLPFSHTSIWHAKYFQTMANFNSSLACNNESGSKDEKAKQVNWEAALALTSGTTFPSSPVYS